ncbi:MAG TPA: preprotein translocase subunit YajC [Candidatus Paceibacterota bacterium]|nr:preprotein translocase subunit YajC [Candidatus Paceibacterota bacterium]
MHLNEILVLAQAAAPAAAPAGTPAAAPGSPLGMVFPMVLIFVVMYFLLIRPQSQQRKTQAKLIAALKSGDKVITSSGIVGVVITVKDNTVSLRSADAKMEVTKASVAQILEGSAAIES